MNIRHNYDTSRPSHGYDIVAIALLIIIVVYGTRFSFGVFFKPILNEFDWTRTLTSSAFTVSLLFSAAGQIFMGRLNDKSGPRMVVIISSIMLGLGYLLMSCLNNAWELYLFYSVFIGLGMSGPFVALLSTIARWFVKRRGMMTGIVIAGTGIGTLIGSPISNWLISTYEWRLSYVILGVAVIVICILAAQVLRRNPQPKGLLPDPENINQFNISNINAQGFTIKETIHTNQFWMVMVMFFCLGYCMMGMSVHIVPHITDLGISSATAAGILGVMGASNGIGCIALGGIADRIGSRHVCIISFILIAVGSFWLLAVNEVWMLYLCAVVFGLGLGGGAPVESTIIAELFGMKAHGAILGVVSGFCTLGGALGPFLMGYLFDLNGNYQIAFLFCAGLGILGLIVSLLLRPINNQIVSIS
jgi:MFS family permease